MNYSKLFRLAWGHASSYSADRSTQNAALLVDPKTEEILALGTNTFICPEFDKECNHERPRKYAVTTHAERSVIYDAANKGLATKGLIMVAPWASCADCARAIVASGISVLVRSKRMLDASPERWLESIAIGDEILATGGVVVYNWPEKLGGKMIRFNGNLWEI